MRSLEVVYWCKFKYRFRTIENEFLRNNLNYVLLKSLIYQFNITDMQFQSLYSIFQHAVISYKTLVINYFTFTIFKKHFYLIHIHKKITAVQI